VQAGEVIIVDEFTGRLMQGRRWSDGLHQAVEAKEKVSIQNENQTLASITFQNYFRMYAKLAGMTGTADTEAYEFQEIYRLETVVIPTHKKMIRDDRLDLVYRTAGEKHKAIIENAVMASNSKNIWTAHEQYPKDLQALIHQDGVHVYRTSRSILQAQLNAWDKVVAKYSAEVPEFKQVIEAQRSWAKNVAYYNLLNAADPKLAYDHYFGKEQPLGF
jgi:hypothetical protein